MSLVLTSNRIDIGGEDRWATPQKPYMYRNYLKETITLPPNSEVAVQSVKISKGETIDIGDPVWYQMYNLNLEGVSESGGAIKTTTDTTGYPIECRLEHNAPGERELPIQEYLDKVSEAMKRGYPHPDVVFESGLSSSGTTDITPICKAYVDETTEMFKGLTFRMNSGETSEDINIATSMINFKKWIVDADPTLSWTPSSGKAQAPTGDANAGLDNVIVLTDYPISLFKGNMRIDLDGVVDDTTDWLVNTDCAFGLVRSFNPTPAPTTELDAIYPPYFEVPHGTLPTPTGNVANHQMMDYVIRIEKAEGSAISYLTLGHATWDATNNCQTMQEIDYTTWGYGTPTFTSKYNMTTNVGKYNQFFIRTEGEQVLFYIHAGAKSTSDNPLDDSGWTLFCGFSTSTGYWTASQKNLYPKPISQTCWTMYPMLYVNTKSGAGAGDQPYINLTAYSGKDKDSQSNDKYCYYCPDYDWWARCDKDKVGGGLIEHAKDVDSRWMNTPSDTSALYDVMPTASKNVVKNYVWAMILKPDDTYYTPNGCPLADADEPFGFSGVKILQPDKYGSTFDGGFGWKYDSSSVPSWYSDNSLFVRLDNYTQKTLNAIVSRPSKILYHIPKFDVSQRGEGEGLYFEPHERTYVKLGNPAELTINDFDISICNDAEVLATELEGQTIVCLHFRQGYGDRWEDATNVSEVNRKYRANQ